MQIAITADVHLGSRQEHPERYRALEDILDQLRRENIRHLVIAGDLFDATSQNYAEFETLCQKSENRSLNFHIIPGNHDSEISEKAIVADNIKIYSEPTLLRLDTEGPDFLFLPYRPDTGMGAEIIPLASQLQGRQWVLIGHGNYADAPREVNPEEPGIYMPVSRRDLGEYKPFRVFLGHIHKQLDGPPVWYAGSPCGLNINETGARRFLVYDTGTGVVTSRKVNTDVLWFNEHFVVIPVPDEAQAIRDEIAGRIKDWELADDERPKVKVRVKLSGYSANRQALLAAVAEGFAGLSFYEGEGPDISEVSSAHDEHRQVIAEKTRQKIESCQRPKGPDEPDAGLILESALNLIYGGKQP